MDFKEKYPLTLRQAVITPMVFRASTPFLLNLPYPCMTCIRDLAEYAGHSYGAVRTFISRTRFIESFQDKRGRTRYRLTETGLSVGRIVSEKFKRPAGFTIAVFSFSRDDSRERHLVRESLDMYGFKKFAQNTYMNGRIEHSLIMKTMRDLGVDKNIFLFDCAEITEPETIERIMDIFDMKGRKIFLDNFLSESRAFLLEKGISDGELARRIFYFGPVHYMKCFVEEPPFPSKYLPKEYNLKALSELFKQVILKNRNKLLNYYKGLNGHLS